MNASFVFLSSGLVEFETGLFENFGEDVFLIFPNQSVKL